MLTAQALLPTEVYLFGGLVRYITTSIFHFTCGRSPFFLRSGRDGEGEAESSQDEESEDEDWEPGASDEEAQPLGMDQMVLGWMVLGYGSGVWFWGMVLGYGSGVRPVLGYASGVWFWGWLGGMGGSRRAESE